MMFACRAWATGDGLPPIPRDPTIKAAIRAGTELVFNLSGGKDSGAETFATIAWLDAIGHLRERCLAIHTDLGRAEWASTPATVATVAPAAGLPGLTRRESEILKHLVAGRTYREIAESLVLSEKTVSSHISSMLRKTGARNRVELARRAADHGSCLCYKTLRMTLFQK